MTDKEKIQELEAELAKSKAQIAEQGVVIATAFAKINQLEALVLSHIIKKTSKNSHLPPSADIARKNQSLRENQTNPLAVKTDTKDIL